MNGFIIIDKPAGMTSHDVVAKARKITGERKIGHAGTLDPLATGVLVLALGEATKLIEYFLGCDKVYEARIELGSVSDTYDADGVVVEFSPKIPKETKIIDILQVNFVGRLNQTPPAHSAVKINGERAYKKARKGEMFEIASRRVDVYSIDLIDYKYPELKLRIFCGKGTYIRSIAHDLGQELKCGAYLEGLRRTRVANFNISDSVSLMDLAADYETYLLPIREVVSHLSHVYLTDQEYDCLKDGGFVQNNNGVMKEPVLGYYKGEVCGVMEFPRNGRLLKFKKKLNIF